MRRLTVALVLAAGLVPMPATAETTYTCFGEPATVVGTPGDDELSGDVVVGLAGVDDLGGRLVCGGKDGDWYLSGIKVDGGPGDDQEIQLIGLGDLAIGPAIGGPGNDRFLDNNWAQEDQPFQVWRGGPGNDRFTGAGGDKDVFYGGAGSDSTGGGEPNWPDTLRQYGGEDDDFLGGGIGRDRIYGGPGNDTLDATRHLWRVDTTIADFIDGGDGFDTCILNVGDRAVNCEDVTVE